MVKKNKKFNTILLILLLMIFAERVIFVFYEGIGTYGGGDDRGYVDAGIFFAKTGLITIWDNIPSARAMPFCAFFFGIISLIFGDGATYVGICKLIYIFMSIATAYFTFKTIALFLPKIYGFLVLIPFLLPNFAWSDKILSTETPYILLMTISLYITFMAGQERERERERENPLCLSIIYGVTITLALTVRANALILPLFSLCYLVIGKKLPLKNLVPSILITVICMCIFIVPWTIRNYNYCYDFIPITDGAGNPNYEGTYFEGCPSDDEINYEPAAEAFRQKYKDYYSEDGLPLNPSVETHLNRLWLNEKAKIRIKYWIQTDLKGFLFAYFIKKPLTTVNNPWFWDVMYDYIGRYIGMLYKLNFILCIFAVVWSITKKEFCAEIISLCLFYWISTFITCLSYACERYNSMLMPIRNYIGIFAVYFIYNILKDRKRNKITS